MPNPKRRHSNTRTRKRRTHDVMKASQMQGCPTCIERNVFISLARHRVCTVCGHYKGRPVVQVKIKEKKRTA
jgi:large subunit ribosomal protein L32